MRRYLAFDLEIATDVPGDFNLWREHRPLGISCAAAALQGEGEPLLWHGEGAGGQPAPRMSMEEVSAMVDELIARVEEGWTLLSWNGLGFDFEVLAEESGRLEDCRRLALGHVDMMFYVFCQKGFPIGLDPAAKAMGLAGKPEGMSGELAPKMWAEGRHDEVLAYVTQDVVTTLEVAEKAEAEGELSWIARSGRRMRLPLRKGFATVRETLAMPEPDTSWMSSPLPRSRFTEWLGEPCSG